MHVLSFPPGAWLGPLALRIDVQPSADELAAELEAIRRRINRRGDALHGLPALGIAPGSGLVFRYREADGEHYVYAEDQASGQVAGYTVFNRLIELSRTADPHLRAPHSRYAPAYQRRGIATAVYRWWLDGGGCLVTGARQSAAAHALWQSLARHHPLFFVDLRDKTLRCLGPCVSALVLDDLHTRMVLLGKGCGLAEFAQRTGMRGV